MRLSTPYALVLGISTVVFSESTQVFRRHDPLSASDIEVANMHGVDLNHMYKHTVIRDTCDGDPAGDRYIWVHNDYFPEWNENPPVRHLKSSLNELDVDPINYDKAVVPHRAESKPSPGTMRRGRRGVYRDSDQWAPNPNTIIEGSIDYQTEYHPEFQYNTDSRLSCQVDFSGGREQISDMRDITSASSPSLSSYMELAKWGYNTMGRFNMLPKCCTDFVTLLVAGDNTGANLKFRARMANEDVKNRAYIGAADIGWIANHSVEYFGPNSEAGKKRPASLKGLLGTEGATRCWPPKAGTLQMLNPWVNWQIVGTDAMVHRVGKHGDTVEEKVRAKVSA